MLTHRLSVVSVHLKALNTVTEYRYRVGHYKQLVRIRRVTLSKNAEINGKYIEDPEKSGFYSYSHFRIQGSLVFSCQAFIFSCSFSSVS